MADMPQKKYTPMQFTHLKGLNGISDGQLEQHFKLYEGYVNRTNKLTETLMGLAQKGEAAGTNPIYAELTRRLGFEYGGMVLHEYYFGNMKPGNPGNKGPSAGKLSQAIDKSFGSFDTFMADFRAIGTMPGVGWAITYQDPRTGFLSNHWVTLHQDGVPSGYTPVLVMDVWEHAYVGDYKPTERAKYVDAWLSNIDWDAAGARVK